MAATQFINLLPSPKIELYVVIHMHKLVLGYVDRWTALVKTELYFNYVSESVFW